LTVYQRSDLIALHGSSGGWGMSFEEALVLASRDEGFKATVYAMNTLLIHKGIYTQDEFRARFVEWVEKEQLRKAPEARHEHSSSAYSA
jgi:hypothetical protein